MPHKWHARRSRRAGHPQARWQQLRLALPALLLALLVQVLFVSQLLQTGPPLPERPREIEIPLDALLAEAGDSFSPPRAELARSTRPVARAPLGQPALAPPRRAPVLAAPVSTRVLDAQREAPRALAVAVPEPAPAPAPRPPAQRAAEPAPEPPPTRVAVPERPAPQPLAPAPPRAVPPAPPLAEPVVEPVVEPVAATPTAPVLAVERTPPREWAEPEPLPVQRPTAPVQAAPVAPPPPLTLPEPQSLLAAPPPQVRLERPSAPVPVAPPTPPALDAIEPQIEAPPLAALEPAAPAPPPLAPALVAPVAPPVVQRSPAAAPQPVVPAPLPQPELAAAEAPVLTPPPAPPTPALVPPIDRSVPLALAPETPAAAPATLAVAPPLAPAPEPLRPDPAALLQPRREAPVAAQPPKAFAAAERAALLTPPVIADVAGVADGTPDATATAAAQPDRAAPAPRAGAADDPFGPATAARRGPVSAADLMAGIEGVASEQAAADMQRQRAARSPFRDYADPFAEELPNRLAGLRMREPAGFREVLRFLAQSLGASGFTYQGGQLSPGSNLLQRRQPLSDADLEAEVGKLVQSWLELHHGNLDQACEQQHVDMSPTVRRVLCGSGGAGLDELLEAGE